MHEVHQQGFRASGRSDQGLGRKRRDILEETQFMKIIGHSIVIWEHAVTGSAAVVTDIDNASWCLEAGLTLNLGNDYFRDDEVNQILRTVHVPRWVNDHISDYCLDGTW
jgi:hypothetical protein